MPIPRIAVSKIKRLAESFPVVSLIGPRQSGKTTLAKSVFPDHAYVSLEDLDNRLFAEEDPRGFLKNYHHNVIIDEAQRAPNLFSYMQTHVDDLDTPGQYILTGSAHLTLLEKLTQSLAGRAALLKLLPLSLTELLDADLLKKDLMEQLFVGFYPRLYRNKMDPLDWYPNYTQTYLEKDVREIVNVKNLLTFKRFLGLCAGRHGQLLDVTELANDCGIARQTANEWLSILEASFLIYFLPSFHKNYSKRLIKSSKLYFYDSGLVCSLLKIENTEQLKTHYLRGAIFEGYVITELLKHRYNKGLEPHVYYWREKNGNEVDCIIEKASELLAIEIKSGQTISNEFFKGLKYWRDLSGNKSENCFLIYGGEENQNRENGKVIAWNNLGEIFAKA